MRKAYGALVIGEEAAARVAEEKEVDRRYGPSVLGSSVDDSPAGEAKRAEGTGQQADGLDDLVKKYAMEDGYLSIGNVKVVLAEMPQSFDRMLGWEMGRADGPRIGALTHFIEVEGKRHGGPRPTILKNLEGALQAVRSKGS